MRANITRFAKKAASKGWSLARSPRTVSFLKLGVALIGVVHAVEELLETPKSGKLPIGFRTGDED